jgi:hypothetical protein
MMKCSCWSCGRQLLVPHDREDRHPKTAGYNTVCGNIRVCLDCWGEIKRCDVTRIDFRRHLRALG